MKKFILGTVAAAILVTSGFGAVPLKEKINACNNFKTNKSIFEKEYSKFRTGTDMQKYINIEGTAQGVEQRLTRNYGNIDKNFLKNIGVKTGSTYKQFLINYIGFVDLLIANNLTKEYSALTTINTPANKKLSSLDYFFVNNLNGFMHVKYTDFLIVYYVVKNEFDLSKDKQTKMDIYNIIKYIFEGKNIEAAKIVKKYNYNNVIKYCKTKGVIIK